MKKLVLALVAALATSASQAEPALTLRPIALQAQPQSDSVTVLNLPADTKVDVLARKGAWMHVRSASGQDGWARITHFKPEAAPSVGGAPGLVEGLLSSGRTSNTAIVTTGVRGLPAKDTQAAAEAVQPGKAFAEPTGDGVFSQGGKLAPLQLGRPAAADK